LTILQRIIVKKPGGFDKKILSAAPLPTGKRCGFVARLYVVKTANDIHIRKKSFSNGRWSAMMSELV